MGKKNSVKWGIMVVIIGLAFLQTKSYGTDWKWDFFLTNAECDCFYDPGTIFRSPENIVRVWWKEVFRTSEVLKSRGFTGTEYEKAVYQINVTEINCPGKEFRRKFYMLCSEKGENISCNIHKMHSNEWIPVSAEQPIAALYLKACR